MSTINDRKPVSRVDTADHGWFATFFLTYFGFDHPYFKSMKARNARIGTLFVMPLIIGFLFFELGPLINSFQMSMSEIADVTPGSGIRMSYVGFSNYNYIFTADAEFSKKLVDEISRMLINTVATLVLSFVIAVLLNQEFKGRTLCRVIFFLPVILSSGVLAGIEKQNDTYNMISAMSDSMASESSVNLSANLQNLLSISGVGNGFFSVIFQMIDAIYDIVMASGIQIIVFLSGLQGISHSLYEAAHVEGCSAWEAFWKITFPMVSPLLLVNAIYTIVDFFMKNDNKVMEYINDTMNKPDFGHASAMSWVYFGVALAFIGVFSFIITRGVRHYDV